MADQPDGYYISARDWGDFQLLMRAFRAAGKVLPTPSAATTKNYHGERNEFAKLDDDVSEGLNTGKTMTFWLGPGWGSGDASLGISAPVDWAADAMTAGTYVTATYKRDKWHVFRLLCEGE